MEMNGLYSHITRDVIGCAMKVHTFFGMGFPETIYHRALLIELEKAGIRFKSRVERDIYYEGTFIGKRRLDLIIEGKVLIELKAVPEIEKSNYSQLINYLKIFDLEVGLLLNFGSKSLQIKRLTTLKQSVESNKNP